MNKNNFEINFNKNISNIIRNKIDELNNYKVILREIIPKIDIKEKENELKLTDSKLLEEIKNLFDEDCITDRTFKNIKDGSTSSSAFNVFIIIYVLNDLSDEINKKYISYGKNSAIKLIDIEELMIPLKA
ncbi:MULTISPECIES: hypothetical protein [unclassified Clostridioides]|uniref:hypothetical protein n=1 Tax=unclassified Clostridioides TaxID=2635829 RepID=UPI001D125D08|nr:hypothetical protein [Clostridioides sp. ES-W-0018-02]MCC0705294.1 hypothetical protein [Clostridioides sp. ES-S-0049-02]MCC0713398.1 hypothetical protein [Clostridioides sp. ES-W-0017-02]